MRQALARLLRRDQTQRASAFENVQVGRNEAAIGHQEQGRRERDQYEDHRRQPDSGYTITQTPTIT